MITNTYEKNGCTGITEKKLKRIITYISFKYEESDHKDDLLNKLLFFLDQSVNGKFSKEIEYEIFTSLRYGSEIMSYREVDCMKKIPYFILRKLVLVKQHEKWERPVIFKRDPEEDIFNIYAVIRGKLSYSYWNFFPLDLEID